MIAVCIVTYNQEEYIAQAIESVLMQQCDEPIRIYIGDDASTDGTSTVCKNYAQKDQRIIYIRRERNLGLVDNTIDLYHRIIADKCEYIAMLDGDDYWIDDYKLQLQINYLQSHPEVGFVHTAAYDDVGGQLIDADKPNKPVGDIHLQYNLEGPQHSNCAVLFRTSLLKQQDLENICSQHFLVLDYPLYGIFSQYTKFGYIYKYTAAWRKHASVSMPISISQFLHYQYHYARAWRWLDKQFQGNFHFQWHKAIIWYSWQFFYALVHFCKIYFTKK